MPPIRRAAPDPDMRAHTTSRGRQGPAGLDGVPPHGYPPAMSMHPATPDAPPITQWLRRAADGDRDALDAVYSALYPDLKRIARARLRDQGRADGLGTTTLLHEGFLRLVAARDLRIEDRRHFFAYAARAMRHIIVDSAREHLALRRGGGAPHDPIDATGTPELADTARSESLLRIAEALRQLEAIDPELAEVVDMRYFGGYGDAEIAALHGVTERTVRRRFEKARAWLYATLGDDTLPGVPPTADVPQRPPG